MAELHTKLTLAMYHPKFAKRYLTFAQFPLGIVLTAFGGCAQGPTPESVPSPSSVIQQADTGLNTHPLLSLFTAGQLRYQLDQVATVEATAPSDSMHRIDSIRTKIGISLTLTREDDRMSARIRVDSGTLALGGGTSTPIISSDISRSYIDLKTGEVIWPSQKPQLLPPEQRCLEKQGEMPLTGLEVVPMIRIPFTNQWTDTLETFECRAGIGLEISRIAVYSRDPQNVLGRIVRSTQATVKGAGYQWTQRVAVNGDGTALDTLEIGGVPSRVQRISGLSQLRLHFTSPRGSQQFVQTVRTQVSIQ
jgi:hypothetical protein